MDAPVEVLVKVKLLPRRHSDVSLVVKATFGAGLTYRFFEILSLQATPLDAINLTGKVPVAV